MTQASPTTATIALTIAGSDPSAGAGIQADLKSFAALGVYGTSVISALTVQNTQGVQACQGVSPDLVEQQLRALLSDMPIAAIKTGMLYSAEIITRVSRVLSEPEYSAIPLVVDTVMVSSSGTALLDKDGISALQEQLLPRATLFTPNLDEAAILLGLSESQAKQRPIENDAERILWAQQLLELTTSYGNGQNSASVLLKGGHGDGTLAQDILLLSDTSVAPGQDRDYVFSAPRINARNTHGTGCTLSAAITAELAKAAALTKATELTKNAQSAKQAKLTQGQVLVAAIDAAKRYLTGALKSADDVTYNHPHSEFSGRGSLNHFHRLNN